MPIGGEDVIYVRNLMTTNEAKKFTREVVSYLDEVSNVGGLSDPILLVGFFFSFLFVDPFRRLDLSLQFSRLKAGIIFQEGLTGGKVIEDGSDGNFAAKYDPKMNWHFHLFWWAYHRLPEFLVDLFFDRKKAARNDHSYQQMVHQLDELHDQCEFLLSVKYQAQGSLVGQIVQFKAEAIANRDDMINLIVTEILRGYNHKSDEYLEIDEMFTLVKEIMPEIDDKFTASDGEVMAAIQIFDEDGDGTYDKSEVENFIKLMMDNGWTEGLKIAKANVTAGGGGGPKPETADGSKFELDFQDSNFTVSNPEAMRRATKPVSVRASQSDDPNPLRSSRG